MFKGGKGNENNLLNVKLIKHKIVKLKLTVDKL